ncbi:hypothetical protein POY37_28375, partial [Klebsiella pneumoniae]
MGTDAVNVNQLNDKAAETLKSANEYSTQQITNAAQTANDRATHLETRADTSEQNIRDVQGAAQTANDRASTLETRADSP